MKPLPLNFSFIIISLGEMLKLLLIITIAIYLLSRVGRFFFGMRASSQNRDYVKPNDGNVNTKGAKEKGKSTIKGGEYIDYEEVK